MVKTTPMVIAVCAITDRWVSSAGISVTTAPPKRPGGVHHGVRTSRPSSPLTILSAVTRNRATTKMSTDMRQKRTFTPSLMMHKYTSRTTIYWAKPGPLSGRPAL